MVTALFCKLVIGFKLNIEGTKSSHLISVHQLHLVSSLSGYKQFSFFYFFTSHCSLSQTWLLCRSLVRVFPHSSVHMPPFTSVVRFKGAGTRRRYSSVRARSGEIKTRSLREGLAQAEHRAAAAFIFT